jgi:hypothetical protein
MWTDISQFDIPEHQKTVSFGLSKEDKVTSIGEVTVVNSIFGKAKIRVIQPRKKRSFMWPLSALAATGMAAIFWLEQGAPKPPEPMRIIVRSVDSEGAVQTSSLPMQGTPTIVKNAHPPTIPAKPQVSPAPNAKTVVVKPLISKPALPPVKSEPVATVPATISLAPVNPQKTPFAANNMQPKAPAAEQPAVKPPAASQSASAQAAAPAIKNESPVAATVAEPLPENSANTIVPSGNAAPPDQTSTQSN